VKAVERHTDRCAAEATEVRAKVACERRFSCSISAVHRNDRGAASGSTNDRLRNLLEYPFALIHRQSERRITAPLGGLRLASQAIGHLHEVCTMKALSVPDSGAGGSRDTSENSANEEVMIRRRTNVALGVALASLAFSVVAMLIGLASFIEISAKIGAP
jgi:hypothetical protein